MEDEINYDTDEGVIKYSCNPKKHQPNKKMYIKFIQIHRILHFSN